MTARPPLLDSRDYEAFLIQLRESVARYMDGWTAGMDADAGADPGVMLQHIYARLMEIAVERLNRVPEKHFLAFLHEMNVSPMPPVPARAPLVFGLSKKQDSPVFIPRGTKTTAKAPGGPPPEFETADDLAVLPASITCAYAHEPGRKRFGDYTERLSGGAFTPFVGENPMPDAWYFVIDDALQMENPTVSKLELSFGAPVGLDDLQANFYSDPPRRIVEWRYSAAGGERGALKWSAGQADPCLNLTLHILDETTREAISPEPAPRLGGGCEPSPGRYIQCAIRYSRQYESEAADLPPVSARFTTEGSESPPRHLFSRNSRLDPEGYTLPFGSRPKAGDAFFIDAGDLPEEAESVNVVLRLIPDADDPRAAGMVGKELSWEKLDWSYSAGGGWKPVIPSREEITEAPGALPTQTNYTYPLAFALDHPGRHAVGGEEGFWLRAVLPADDCGIEAQYTADANGGYKWVAGTGIFVYPKLRSITVSIGYSAGCRVYRQRGHIYRAPGSPAQYAEDRPGLDRSAFYLGFDRFIGLQPVSLYADAEPAASGARLPEDASPLWEYLAADGWRTLYVQDDSGGFSRSGAIRFLTPSGAACESLFDNTARYWVRASHDSAVRLRGIYMNAVPAEQAVTVSREALGVSNGAAGQRFSLRGKPVLPGQQVWIREDEAPTAAELSETEVEIRRNPVTLEQEHWVLWQEQNGFSVSQANSRHYIINRENGEIRFGGGALGMAPPEGADIAVAYRYGGGAGGNLPAEAVTKLSTKHPGVESVYNPIPAVGGADSEDIPDVMERGPMRLRHRGRGVTAPDIEWLVKEAAGAAVDRIKCLPGDEGQPFTLMLLPAEEGLRPLPDGALSARIREYLNTRLPASLSGRSFGIVGPRYITTDVSVGLVPSDPMESTAVRERAAARLEAFLHPRLGGLEGEGWAFGRNVYLSEVCALLESVEGVGHTLAGTVSIRPAAAQRELTLQTNDLRLTAAYPAGSLLTLSNHGEKTAEQWLLAEPIDTDVLPRTIRVTGLREGDELAISSAFTFCRADQRFDGNVFDFPAGSLARFDNGHTAKLARPLWVGDVFTLNLLDRPDDIPPKLLKDGSALTLLHPDALVVTKVQDTADGGYAVALRRPSADLRLSGNMVLECTRRRVKAAVSNDYVRKISYEGDRIIIPFGGFNETRRLEGPVSVSLSRQSERPESITFKINAAAPVDDTAYLYGMELCTPGAVDVRIAGQEEA